MGWEASMEAIAGRACNMLYDATCNTHAAHASSSLRFGLEPWSSRTWGFWLRAQGGLVGFRAYSRR